MIKLIQSPKISLPIVYLVETSEDVKNLPLGVPFIRASIQEYNKCVKMLEWEVIWEIAMKSKLPFKWYNLLIARGYKVVKGGLASGGHGINTEDGDLSIKVTIDENIEKSISIKEFVDEAGYKVDIELLRSLNLLPTWLEDIEAAVKHNITNTITFNPMLYTKKLELPLGEIEYSPGLKNVIIIDISGSIPKSIADTMIMLAKTLSEQFYADIMFTGGISKLYDYSELDSLNTSTIYREVGQNNDQSYFRELLEIPRKYKTAIVFGDDDSPGYPWNPGTDNISPEQGKSICKWEINELISFHTKHFEKLAGYALWFDTKNIRTMKNWVKYLN